MALSNIWSEPRKEITETIVGLGISIFWVALVCGGWMLLWAFTYHFLGKHWPNMKNDDRAFIAFLSPVALIVFGLIFVFIHEVGEQYLKNHRSLRRLLRL